MTDTDDLLQRLRNSPPREICEHGSQRVKCAHCECIAQDAEIERLRAEVELRLSELDAAWKREKELTGRATRAESELAALRGRMSDCGKCGRLVVEDGAG